MATFKLIVFETRAVEMIYEIEADSFDAAVDKAEQGDTVSEDMVRELGVNSRTVEGPA